MKRIFFNKNGQIKRPSIPFWQPWGCLGCFWRTLVFLVCLVAVLTLLSMLRTCGKYADIPIIPDNPKDSIYIPDSVYSDIDTSRVSDWGEPIPGVPEFPDSNSNVIPPISDDDIITNPDGGIGEIVDNQLIVFFNSYDRKSDMTSFARQFKALYASGDYEIAYYNMTSGTMLLTVPKSRLLQLFQEIPQHITDIDYLITTNQVLQESKVPNDPGFNYDKISSYYDDIQAFPAWDITTGNPNVKVAIVDSYFCLDHDELNSRWMEPINIPSKTRNVLPPSGTDMESACHGSHVAGIAIGNANNYSGACGIAPDCSWIPVSLGDKITTFHLLEGILYAIYRGADVVNVSIGSVFGDAVTRMPLQKQINLSKTTSKAMEAVWNYVYKVATDRRCVIVTAAGNDNILMALDCGKRNSHIIKVSATSGSDTKADFSNFGNIPQVNMHYSTVSAPGVGILSSVVNNSYAFFPGTSMASPFVAGTVALMKSLDKNLTSDDVIEILSKTGHPLNSKYMVGPLIQINNALGEVKRRLLNYDDLIRNHNLLLGKWEATESLRLVSAKGDEKLDDLYLTMFFNTPSTGNLTYYTYGAKNTYNAPLSVQYVNRGMVVRQLSDAVCVSNPQIPYINADKYICRPDKNRLLLMTVIRDKGESFSFHMKKIK